MSGASSISPAESVAETMDNPQSDPNLNTKSEVGATRAPIAPARLSELDSPSRSLPFVPILIAVVVIGACVGALLYFTHPTPIASVRITKIIPVEQVTKDRVLVTMEAAVRNLSSNEIIVRGIDVKLVTPQGEARDVPAPATDLPRYFKAYPGLQQSTAAPLIDNTRIKPGTEQAGMFVVGFPVTKDAFDKRQSIEVTIHLYGQRPLVIKQ